MNAFTTNLTSWLSPSAMQSLGWALVHFLWQGAALAALAAAAMALCHRASVRYLVGVSALFVMLAAPVATFFLMSRTSFDTTSSSTAGTRAAQVWQASGAAKATPGATSRAASLGGSSPDALLWLVETWLIGVAFFSLRTAGGFVLLERQQRRQSRSVSGIVLEECLALQRRLGLNRIVRFRECGWLQAPAVIGWFRPVVLLPFTTLSGLSQEQLEVVIAHELAHIKRFDAFVNVFQICVETLLFYHPAVWWLNKRIRTEREHCCDDMAVSLCGNAVEYARALTLMEEWRSAPVLAMAANRGPLSERIVRLLGLKPARNSTLRVGLAGSILCLGAALLAGNTLLGMAYPKAIAQETGVPPHPLSLRAAAVWAQTHAVAQTAAAPAAKPSAAIAAQREHHATAQSYIDAMTSAGLTDLTADQLVALKIQGVTPEYVHEIYELGLHLDANELVGMKVQGVSPEYIRELRALGFTHDQNQIIALKIQGVNADYVRGLKEVGIEADSGEIIALKIQGVTPEYVRELRASGLTVDSGDVIALKVQGVTPKYVHGLQALDLKPSAGDVISMRVQDVTPEYIRAVRALGLNPNIGEIIGMRVQGVTAEYIKALQLAGFKVDVRNVISAKVQGLTPEFVEQARKQGFQNLTLEKLIELHRMGVLETKGDI